MKINYIANLEEQLTSHIEKIMDWIKNHPDPEKLVISRTIDVSSTSLIIEEDQEKTRKSG